MKTIGIGYENYKDFIEKGLYYVDKTMLAADILKKGGKVTLLTRPRRFGKTLALSMLRTFFELEYDPDGNPVDKQPYFEGMKIMEDEEGVLSQMGSYPIINLTLKGAKQPDYKSAFEALAREIIREFRRHDYLISSKVLEENEKKSFLECLSGDVRWGERAGLPQSVDEKEESFRRERGIYAASVKLLSELLQKHHKKQVIILIDEYDVPLENAWYAGFYPEMSGFVRSLFESALKTNEALERAVITGCLRISKESIFTGLNNLQIISIRSDNFSESCGFTVSETMQMLEDFGLSDKRQELREWYDGYLFGYREIYNPWSVTKYIYDHLASHDAFPEPYWSNTSANHIIKDLVTRAGGGTREELDALIGGGTIEKRIHEDITYQDIYESEDNLWNFLFFTGYMKKVSERKSQEDIYMTMSIPNREIRYIYRNQIRTWFDQLVEKADRTALYRAIREKDCRGIEDYVTELLDRCISYFDSAEDFYHGFFLSLLYGMPYYSPRSNREAGGGRPDILLYPNRPRDPAYIFECKVRKKFGEMEDGLEEAYRQIRTQRYAEGIIGEGYAGVISYGICFCKKSCIVGII